MWKSEVINTMLDHCWGSRNCVVANHALPIVSYEALSFQIDAAGILCLRIK